MTHPSIFYKYTTASTAIKVLETGCRRWSSPKLFNDLSEFQRMPRFEPTASDVYPKYLASLIAVAFGDKKLDEQKLHQDCKPWLRYFRQQRDSGKSKAELIAQTTLSMPDADNGFEATLRNLFNTPFIETSRVLCLSTEFDNEAMWAHYADDHKGCVLGFRHIKHLDTLLLAAKPVEYTEHPPVVGSGLDFWLYGYIPEWRENTFEAVCFSKKARWSYEREWRIVTWEEEAGDALFIDLQFHPEELESVTIGPNTSPETEKRIRELLKAGYPKCSLFRFSIKNGEATRVKA